MRTRATTSTTGEWAPEGEGSEEHQNCIHAWWLPDSFVVPVISSDPHFSGPHFPAGTTLMTLPDMRTTTPRSTTSMRSASSTPTASPSSSTAPPRATSRSRVRTSRLTSWSEAWMATTSSSHATMASPCTAAARELLERTASCGETFESLALFGVSNTTCVSQMFFRTRLASCC